MSIHKLPFGRHVFQHVTVAQFPMSAKFVFLTLQNKCNRLKLNTKKCVCICGVITARVCGKVMFSCADPVLFGRNVCDNERIGSCLGGGVHTGSASGSATDVFILCVCVCLSVCLLVCVSVCVIGGSRGDAAGLPPPTGSISFVFAYVFTKKCTCWRSAPPPPTGNPGSTTVCVCTG